MQLSPQKLRALVEGAFTVIPSRCTRDEIVFLCPEPGCQDQSGNRSVNVHTLVTNCWRCNRAGNFLNWAHKLGHEFDLNDIDLYDQRSVEELYGDLDALYVSKRSVIAYVNDVKLPRGFTPIADEIDSGYVRLIERMALRKHLDLATFIRAGAGFTRDDYKWEPYCIFPVYEWGKIVYYQGRTYTDPRPDPVTGKRGNTKKFPSNSEIKLGSRYWVYNVDRLRQKGRIGIVVESMFNVYSLERVLGLDSDIVPVAVFKHAISPEQQAKLLTATGLEELCLFFDPDAISSAWSSCHKLVNLIKVTVADKMPDRVDANDDAEEALRCFERRHEWSALSDLERRAAEL